MLGSAVCQTTGSARQRYERGSILVTTNLPFDEWTEVFGSESKTGFALTDAPFVAGG
jgi:DNA replication protein DnaC